MNIPFLSRRLSIEGGPRPARNGPRLDRIAAVAALVASVTTCTMLTWSCTGIDRPGTGTIEFVVVPPGGERFSPLTLTPGIPFEVVEYTVTGSGPEGATFEVVVAGSAGSVDSLVLGPWSLAAVGRNSTGEVISRGEAAVEVSAVITAVSITMELVEGVGTLDITVTIADLPRNDHAVAIEATGPDGVARELPVVTASTGLFTASSTLPAGVYFVEITLYDGLGERISGAVLSAFVLADRVTVGSVEIAAGEPSTSSITIGFDSSGSAPVDFTIESVPAAPYFTGSSASFSLSGTIDETATVSWYLDGVPVATTGATFTHTFDEAGFVRIDAIVRVGGVPVGSESLLIEVVDPVRYGRYVYLSSAFDNTGGVDGLSDVRDVVTHPTAPVIYAAGYGESSVAVFTKSGAGTAPSYHSRLRSTAPWSLTGVSALAVAPDGSSLAAVTGTTTITLLGLDGTGIPDGSAVLIEAGTSAPDLSGIASVVWSETGVIYGAAETSNHLVTCRPSTTGWEEPVVTALAPTGGAGETVAPIAVAASPCGRWVAVSGRTSDSIGIFDVTVTTSPPVRVAWFGDGIDGVDGLNGGGGLVFTADGTMLYAVGYYDNAVTSFRVDEAAGWSYVAMVKDDVGGVEGMRYPRDVALCADEAWLLVASSGDDSLAVFSRDLADGSLTFEGVALNGSGGIVGLDGARSVAIDPTDGSVFVAASNESALVTFVVME